MTITKSLLATLLLSTLTAFGQSGKIPDDTNTFQLGTNTFQLGTYKSYEPLIELHTLTPTYDIIFMANGTNKISISLTNGAVTLSPGLSIDAASKQFWTSMTSGFNWISPTIAESYLGMSKDELIKALRDVRKYLNPSAGFEMTTLEYRSPSAELRRQADAIEARDAAIRRFDELVSKLDNKASTNLSTNLLWNP